MIGRTVSSIAAILLAVVLGIAGFSLKAGTSHSLLDKLPSGYLVMANLTITLPLPRGKIVDERKPYRNLTESLETDFFPATNV